MLTKKINKLLQIVKRLNESIPFKCDILSSFNSGIGFDRDVTSLLNDPYRPRRFAIAFVFETILTSCFFSFFCRPDFISPEQDLGVTSFSSPVSLPPSLSLSLSLSPSLSPSLFLHQVFWRPGKNLRSLRWGTPKADVDSHPPPLKNDIWKWRNILKHLRIHGAYPIKVVCISKKKVFLNYLMVRNMVRNMNWSNQ